MTRFGILSAFCVVVTANAASTGSQIMPGFAAAGPAKVSAPGPINVGDVFLTIPTRFEQTGVLQGDLNQSAVGFARLVMKSGTPVVRYPMSHWDSPIKKFAWCGPDLEPGPGNVGWCMLEGNKQFDQLWKVTSGSAYLPGQIQRLMVFKDPRPTVEVKKVEIPEGNREQTWRLVSSKKDRVEIAVSNSPVGKDASGGDVIKLKRDKSGAAVLRILDGELRLLAGSDESKAILEISKPITAQ